MKAGSTFLVRTETGFAKGTIGIFLTNKEGTLFGLTTGHTIKKGNYARNRNKVIFGKCIFSRYDGDHNNHKTFVMDLAVIEVEEEDMIDTNIILYRTIQDYTVSEECENGDIVRILKNELYKKKRIQSKNGGHRV